MTFLFWGRSLSTGRATLHEWALIFYGTSTLPDRTEYRLYNPAAISVPRNPFLKTRETIFSRNQISPGNGSPKANRQGQQKSDRTGSMNPSYVVNGQTQPQRKNKSRGQHKNGKLAANRPTPRPTIQTLRGLTSARGPNVGETRFVTSRPRSGKSTVSPVTIGSPTMRVITTKPTLPQSFSSRQRIVVPATVSSLQRGLILMEPAPAKAATNMVPAIFQQYPKIQQLYPLYRIYAGARGAGQQHSTRAKGHDVLQDEQFDTRNLQLDKGTGDCRMGTRADGRD